MQIHELKSVKRGKVKRIGRGGKRGTYSGRGQKGQKARAGHRLPPPEKALFSRLPKLKGVKNKSFRPKPVIINVGDLEKIFSVSSIDKKIVLEKGLIKKIAQPFKILGSGEIKKAFTVSGVPVSASAKKKIEKAGGKINESR